jgi:hypothetical protein
VHYSTQLEHFASVLAAVGGQVQGGQRRCLHGVQHEPERVKDEVIVIKVESLESREAADGICQQRDVSALQTLLCKLEAAHVAAECEHVEETRHMEFGQLIGIHLQGPQVHQRQLLTITEFQLQQVHRRTALEMAYPEMELYVVHSRGKQH